MCTISRKPKPELYALPSPLALAVRKGSKRAANVDVDRRRRRRASSHGSLRADNLLADFFGHQNVTTNMQR